MAFPETNPHLALTGPWSGALHNRPTPAGMPGRGPRCRATALGNDASLLGRREQARLATGRAISAGAVARQLWRAQVGPATVAAMEGARFGTPQIVTPRLGQGSFRLLIADSYQRRCTMTGERTLPALEAAHIHRYSRGGDHSLSNGLLLRSDLHKLFDLGYLSIEPNTLKIRVSGKIREEFENGRDYYRLDGQQLRHPENPHAFPSLEKLKHHYETEFRG